MARIGTLPTGAPVTLVSNLSAPIADTSWCNKPVKTVGVCATPKPLTSTVSKGRLSAPGVIHPAGSPEKNHRTYSSKWQSARVDNGVDAMGGCGFESRCVRFAVACAVTRTHHPCEAVCKRKNLGVSQLRPSFIGSSVLSDAVQRRTMLYKTRYEYRYIYRGPNVFNTELPGCAR